MNWRLLVCSSLFFALGTQRVNAQESFIATHYGESYNGSPLGCGGTYASADASIAAVAYPARDVEWPCGIRLIVSGPAGTIVVTRRDSCPGCTRNMIDLSESGITQVCGGVYTCEVKVWQE